MPNAKGITQTRLLQRFVWSLLVSPFIFSFSICSFGKQYRFYDYSWKLLSFSDRGIKSPKKIHQNRNSWDIRHVYDQHTLKLLHIAGLFTQHFERWCQKITSIDNRYARRSIYHGCKKYMEIIKINILHCLLTSRLLLLETTKFRNILIFKWILVVSSETSERIFKSSEYSNYICFATANQFRFR